MQITVNNDFQHSGTNLTQADVISFLQDEQTAVNILNSTFTDNITVTFDVGFGSYRGGTMQDQSVSLADINSDAVFTLTYSQLRTDLLTFGQPGFFNAANLPAGNSLNGVTNFWISSSVGASFGLFTPKTDGFVGIGTGFIPGSQRVSAFLHEMGHAMGRVSENLVFNGITYFSALDLVRFTAPGVRLFNGNNPNNTPAYFSLDGGTTKLADWGETSDVSDFLNNALTGNDPFNEFVGTLGHLTNLDILVTEALGFKTVPPAPPGNPPPPPGTIADMVLRHGADGLYEIYDIGGNRLLAAYQLGQVGTD
jgi:serralysin